MRRSTVERSLTWNCPFERSSNSAMSFSRTWASMNSRNGVVIATKASSWLILLSISGLRPFCQARSKVGAMTNMVMNSARLVSTRLAGVLCRPKPGPQKRKRDDESREARDHDQQAGRDRKHRQNRDHLHDAPGRRRAAARKQSAEVEGLRARRRDENEEGEDRDRDALHWTTRVRKMNSLTLPPERVMARSLRS